MGMQRDGVVGTGDAERDSAVLAHFGDGASSQGDVNEAFIFAASYNAPVVFFCQNNQWAISEPIERQSRIPLYQRALGFGFPGLRVDGNDVLATHAVTKAALNRAREGQGPTFVEAYTYRMGAHTTTDDPTRYRLSDDVEKWKLRDPIARVEVYLKRNGLADEDFIDGIRAEADDLGARLREGCKALPDPQPLSIFDHVYSEMTDELAAQRDGYAAYLELVSRGATHERHEDHPGEGPQHGPAQGDGGRPQGPAHGRGRRQARRRLPHHRRPAEGLRRGPGHRQPARRVRHRRHRGRHGDARLPPGGRDPVRRVRLPGVRPDRLPGREDPLPQPGQDQDADRHPDPVRWRHRRGRAPLGVAGGAVRAHAGPQGRRLLQPGRRLLDDPAGHRPRRPGDLPRAQAAVPRRQGRARRDRHARPALQVPHRQGRARTRRCSPTARR